MSEIYTKSHNKLIEEFSKLPSIGPKSAERLAFYILNTSVEQAMGLARSISDVKTKIKQCKICYNFSENDICEICSNPSRDKSTICVVEQPKDIISLEKTGNCKWVYHVLQGHIAPLEGVEPDDLTIESLVQRVNKGDVEEIIMATNPNIAGDGTALYINSLIKHFGTKVTRLARGLPTGSTIEYSSGRVLMDAIMQRQDFQ